MDAGTLHTLLLRMQTRLLRTCAAEARTRGGLDAHDLAQGAMVLFLQRAPRWFAQPPHTSLEAQAWALLKTCVRNLVTDYDRAVRVEYTDTGDPEDGEHEPVPGVDAPTQPPPHAEAEVLQTEADRRRERCLVEELEEVRNPVYRLVLKAVYVPRLLEPDDFAAADAHRVSGAVPFVRPWRDAAELVLANARSPLASSPDETDVWRAFLARCIRMTGDPWREPLSTAARAWLDKNLSRAREALGLPPKETDA